MKDTLVSFSPIRDANKRLGKFSAGFEELARVSYFNIIRTHVANNVK